MRNDAMEFLKKLLGRGCKHKFSWPRVDANGRHYQICSGCGIAYEYDWKLMRRTGQLLVSGVGTADPVLIAGIHHA